MSTVAGHMAHAVEQMTIVVAAQMATVADQMVTAVDQLTIDVD